MRGSVFICFILLILKLYKKKIKCRGVRKAGSVNYVLPTCVYLSKLEINRTWERTKWRTSVWWGPIATKAPSRREDRRTVLFALNRSGNANSPNSKPPLATSLFLSLFSLITFLKIWTMLSLTVKQKECH